MVEKKLPVFFSLIIFRTLLSILLMDIFISWRECASNGINDGAQKIQIPACLFILTKLRLVPTEC